MTIPDEAVEAACEFVAHGSDRRPNAPYIRALLEAALPFIQAQTLRDAVDAFPLETIHAPDTAVVWMMRRAEEIEGKQ